MTDSTKKENLKLKIISLIFAIVLWGYVMAQTQISGKDSNIVSLNYYNQEVGLEVTGPETVKVTVWGKQIQKNEMPTAYVDLQGLSEGVHELPVEIMPVKGAVLTKVEPNEVQVTIGSASKKNMSVGYEVMTQPPEGYQLQKVMLVPENCVIKGKENALQKVSRVVAQVYLSNVYTIQEQQVRLIAVDAAGEAVVEGVTVIPSEADATILVEEIKEQKTIQVTANLLGQAPEGYQVTGFTITPSSIQIFGSHNQIQNMNSVSLGNISISGKTQSFSQMMNVTLGNEIIVYPSQVRVDVQMRAPEPVYTEVIEEKTEEEEPAGQEPEEQPAEQVEETEKTEETEKIESD